MSMEPIKAFTSRVVPLLAENIDTDQIIPARFLKVIDKAGLGDNLFADWRYEADGTPKPDFVLNQPGMRGRQILLAGDNFGCGSSREHAPWALVGYGFRAVLSTSFADIFRGNALKNGLLPIVVGADVHGGLTELLADEPEAELRVDLAEQSVRLPDGSRLRFEVDPFSRSMLLEGTDELGYLLGHEQRIAAFEAAHPARFDTTVPAGG
jgi:3-isopropylmalate/(R)-2-methylmalate dehydratase small subunit